MNAEKESLMRETIDAIYERGVLRPLKPVPWLTENDSVRITIVTEDGHRSLAACVGILPDEDADEMKKIVAAEFEEINSDEWK
jgi:predicted DNA-binding antitoxin AbrB/MazE fold protein